MPPLDQPIVDRRSDGVAMPLLRRAILLSGPGPSSEDQKLGEVIDFFGIPWNAVSIGAMIDGRSPAGCKYCILSRAPHMAQALQAAMESGGALPCWLTEANSVYIYGFEDTDACRNLLRFLTGDTQARIHGLNSHAASMSVTSFLPDICGPMSGMRVPVEQTHGDLVFGLTRRDVGFDDIINTSDGQVFVRVMCQGVPFYLNVHSKTIDISSSSAKNFDVKKHFCSAVPITMYLKWAFRDVCWRSPEISACLVVDDPPLKPRYGFLRFRELSNLMDEQSFTTAIAFIPWNYRRTDRNTVDLFRNRLDRFSLAVHGCDHTGDEFGTRSAAVLDRKVKTARQRMNSLGERTSLQYARVMVFPQGVFSPEIGNALKLNGFVAAVNTEVAPCQDEANETQVRDLWDVAIIKYGTFPIFTRRYLNDGIENFAFDGLLGKPCLIAAHHDVFKGHGRDLADFVARLNSLNWNLCWRPLGEAIDHCFRVRTEPDETIAIRMFAESLVLETSTAKTDQAVFIKEESDPGCVEAVTVNQHEIDFNYENGCLQFSVRLFPKETARVRVTYFESQNSNVHWENGGIGYNVKTRLRRYLSEFRDNYISQSDFLYKSATRIKQRLQAEKKHSLIRRDVSQS